MDSKVNQSNVKNLKRIPSKKPPVEKDHFLEKSPKQKAKGKKRLKPMSGEWEDIVKN